MNLLYETAFDCHFYQFRPILTGVPMDSAEKAQVLSRLERIQFLTGQLAKAHGNALESQVLSERISRELEATKEHIRTFATHDRDSR